MSNPTPNPEGPASAVPATLPPGGTRLTAPPAAPDDARFTLARFVEWVALAVLLGAIARALHPFYGWWVAVPVGITLTYSFSQLVHLALRPGQWGVRLLAGISAMVLACVTSSLTYSSIYATTAAGESARRDHLAKRERTQRDLQRLVSTAESAQKALADWAANAQAKSEAEARGGNTCPGRETKPMPGPISTWRADDAQVARTLAEQLQHHTLAAREATTAVLGLPEPDDYSQVKAAYAVLNRAIEATVPLSKGGWAGPSLMTLGDRRSSQIVYPGGQVLSCGDGARLSLIDTAAQHLKLLDDTPSLARLAPVIDLSQAQEVTTRGLVRGMNLLAYTVSLGRLGQFKDDALMVDALKQGAFTRETASFGLAILAELSVFFSAMLRRQAGAAPFELNLPAWVRAASRRPAPAGRLEALLRGAATLLSNLFYARPTEGPTAPAAAPGRSGAVALGPESSQFGAVTLADDPSMRSREEGWAVLLYPYHHSWGDEQDYLVLPNLPEVVVLQKAARSLAADDLMWCRAEKAGWREVCQAPFADELRAHLGDRCEKLTYVVYAVRPDYAQLLRLAMIAHQMPPQPTPAALPPAVPAVAAQPVAAVPLQAMAVAPAVPLPPGARARHLSLQRRLRTRLFGGQPA